MYSFHDIITSLEQMVNLSFSGLFRTSLKGLPNTNQLPSYITLTKSFFIYSTILQSIFLIMSLLLFALSVFRLIKKIKNERFKDARDPLSVQIRKKRSKKNKRKEDVKQEQKIKYPFQDDEDEEFEERSNKVLNQNGQVSTQKDEFEEYHDQNERSFIKLDNQILSFQPLLISFVICNSVFATDTISISLIILTYIAYALFNIKGLLQHIKLINHLFLIFPLLTYFSYFYNDHDLTT